MRSLDEVKAPGGNRRPSEPTHQMNDEKGTAIMTHRSDTTEQGAFKGDRYDRLAEAAKILADDEGLTAAKAPYNSEGLLAFAAEIAQLKLLDGLSEYDSNTIGFLVLLDFLRGPQRMAWRIYDMLSDSPETPAREHDNEIAVVYSMAGILRMVIGAWLEPDPLRNLKALAADAAEAYALVKERPGNAGDYLLAARDSIADAIEALG
ncbi:hypothetical protein F0Q45_13050 [Mycobacterium simiae]|uniref:Uncharacterized protein n=1 Tax=Mycobacterium simiae TaxID=1784 RepID=A0A5B1BN29_MYCSI|nr:hypothetical protein [Mycobacterium simiae]KAA1249806.1 hypothetical protein F0Q45_13050 [Mycobacterium simiae]